ncbi:MAG: YicC family protein [Bacteroidales bacterium]|nr:YicC family protein [Bacteroidales bacterium]
MTGYGKAECTINGNKYTVEIRSVNGKNADISIKTGAVPRDKEMQLRSFLAKELSRGSIDLFINIERSTASAARNINAALFKEYYTKINTALEGTPLIAGNDSAYLINAILHLPDVVENANEVFGDQDWDTLFASISNAVAALNAFRSKEGEALEADLTSRLHLIESYIPQVEAYEAERTEAVKNRLLSHLEEIGAVDRNRLEQEMIYYIEKLDINEEKVRLKQHCRYFKETMSAEENPGKKLGFIAQEMGREINTMGSKANHAEIQKIVVKMKDELEKIKEQSLNIL